MNTNTAREILGIDGDLAGWWSEYNDPSGTTRAHHDPSELAEAALSSFPNDWEDMCAEYGLSLDDIRDALIVVAGEAVEEAPE